MHLLTASLLFAAHALAQAPPAADGTDTLVIEGVAPAGSESGFQASFLDVQNGETGYEANCTGAADYCVNGYFFIATSKGGYTLISDVNSDPDDLSQRTSTCTVEGDVGTCDVEIRDDSDNVLSTGTETKTGAITLTLAPVTVTSGDGYVSTTVTTRPQITSTIESTVTVPTTVPSSSVAASSGAHSSEPCNSTSTIHIPRPTGGNNTAPTIVRPSLPAYTGAASSFRMAGATIDSGVLVTMGGTMMAVAALAFAL
ncbi:hypothetical protein KVT40_002578 [Elsinoe batatas]|uniref:Uncharacterized protein n=1 Tax=Elsinoe batatas TaxID=2601811 RepID=A0A8K0L5V5_9PEZI|nr:hypothetical protein KVT40_002578 [Elsinoe batatas]